MNETTGFFSLNENATQRIPFNIYKPSLQTPLLCSLEIKRNSRLSNINEATVFFFLHENVTQYIQKLKSFEKEISYNSNNAIFLGVKSIYNP